MVMLLLTMVYTVTGQSITIQLYGLDAKGKRIELPSAKVHNKNENISATTDSVGKTTVSINENTRFLLCEASGFETDTLFIQPFKSDYKILLLASQLLGEVNIVFRDYDNKIDLVKTIKVEEIGQKELKKAACCNLAESFESNASVDVVYTDAVTGARTIQMLGLSGLYAPIQIENIPYTRGLAANFGMTFIPGTWLQGVQITKGIGSVVNGYESMAGMINIELLKPELDKTERLFVNVYGSHLGRAEGNIHLGKKFNDKISTLLFIHGNGNFQENDQNNDGFRDNPLSKQYNIMNRWKRQGKKTEQVFMVHSLYDAKNGGQTGATPFAHENGLYSAAVNTQMHQIYFKNGFLFPEKTMASLGLIGSYRYHDHQSTFGHRIVNARQQSGYFNSIYNDYIGNTFHTFKAGASLIYDHTELFNNGVDTTLLEYVPGVYFEYNYAPGKVFNMLIGARADYHNTYGMQYTPRIHLRYLINEKISIRALAGTGWRTSKTVMENLSGLVSSRSVFVRNDLLPEQSFNTGVSYTQEITVGKNKWMFNADYYYTQFLNQVVVDYDMHPQELHFYNLTGESYSHSVQAELDMLIVRGLQLKVAYKRNVVKQTVANELQDKAMVAPARFMANVNYQTNNKKWKFDLINNYVEAARVPSTEGNPHEFHFMEKGMPMWIMHFQVTKLFRKFEVYLGAENILNQTQKQAIISPENPFGPYFDAGLIWGPLNGTNIYGGLRYSLFK